MKRLGLLILLMAVGPLAGAESLSEVVEHAMVPITMLAQIMYAVCYIVGSGLIVGSLLRYKEHRHNPTKVNFSKPIMFFLFGLVLVFLPLVAQHSDAVTAFSLD